MKRFLCVFLMAAGAALAPFESHAAVTTTGGIVLREEGGTFAPGNLSTISGTFALDIEGQTSGTNQPIGYGGAHTTTGVANGAYGNTGAWLAGTSGSFIGISLGAAPVNVQSIAFGRDNTGQFGDRADGRTYTLQYTTTPSPNNTTASWTTIGTITYAGNDALSAGMGTDNFNFNARRHRFDFASVNATGLRLLAPGFGACCNGTGVDEFEIYSTAGGPTAPATLVQTGGLAAATGLNHASSANGGTAFGSPALGGVHTIPGANDGIYGNSNSWLGSNNGQQGFIGVDFAGATPISISSIAFGRDNLGTFSDRNAGNYTFQYTTDPNPSSASATWTVIDGVTYAVDSLANANRHRYAFNAISATGVRLQVSSNTIAIDELEAFGSLNITPASGHTLTWDGNDGDHFSAGNPAVVPANIALASAGATAFSDGDLGGIHTTAKLNDGLYGNSNSWISDGDSASFAGVDLPGANPWLVDSIAFGRDNGNDAEGQFTDRSLGQYSLQYTLLDGADATTLLTGDAATGWEEIGLVDFLANVDSAPDGFFTEWLRHEFAVGADGLPLLASGLRIVSPNGNAIDELEVYGTATPEPASFALWVLLGVAGVVGFVRQRRGKR